MKSHIKQDLEASWEEELLSLWSWGVLPSQLASILFTNLKAFRNPSFRFFGGFVGMVDWIIDHWWLIKSPAPLSSLEVEGWGWIFQSANHLVGCSGNQPPSSKSHFICINSGMVERSLLWMTKDVPLTPHCSGNYAGFKRPVLGTGWGGGVVKLFSSKSINKNDPQDNESISEVKE